MIRFFDIFISLFTILLSLPFLIIIFVINVFVTKGNPFFAQKRVGMNGKTFSLLKFRTMFLNSDSAGRITIGAKDSRITPFGYFLRKYKFDEFPQLWNVMTGDMSLVGPRPELSEYVSLYTSEQKKILKVRPGITDYASLEYINESEILAASSNPEKTYIEEIVPNKIELNKKFINDRSLKNYFLILSLTAKRLFTGH